MGSGQGGGFSKLDHSMWDREMKPRMYQMNPAKNSEPSLKTHSRSSMETLPMIRGSQNIWSIPLLIEGDTGMNREKDLWGMMELSV